MTSSNKLEFNVSHFFDKDKMYWVNMEYHAKRDVWKLRVGSPTHGRPNDITVEIPSNEYFKIFQQSKDLQGIKIYELYTYYFETCARSLDTVNRNRNVDLEGLFNY